MIKKVNINSGNYYKKLSKRKAFICGLKGTKLTKSEIIFLKKINPMESFYSLEILKRLTKLAN